MAETVTEITGVATTLITFVTGNAYLAIPFVGGLIVGVIAIIRKLKK